MLCVVGCVVLELLCFAKILHVVGPKSGFWGVPGLQQAAGVLGWGPLSAVSRRGGVHEGGAVMGGGGGVGHVSTNT